MSEDELTFEDFEDLEDLEDFEDFADTELFLFAEEEVEVFFSSVPTLPLALVETVTLPEEQLPISNCRTSESTQSKTEYEISVKPSLNDLNLSVKIAVFEEISAPFSHR